MNLQRDLAEWATGAGVLGANHLAKVRDELEELESAPSDPHEMADVMLALMLHAEQNGVNLMDAALEKLGVVKTRTYGAPDERGVVRHIPKHPVARVQKSHFDERDWFSIEPLIPVEQFKNGALLFLGEGS